MTAPGVPVQIMLRGGGKADGWPALTGSGSGAAAAGPGQSGSGAGLRAADAMIGFESGGRRLTTRLIAGEFIKYKTRFPAEFSCVGDMPATALTEAVKRVALVAERGTSVRLSFGQDRVMIEAGTEGQARARETVTAEFKGDEPAIAFSPGYLLDGLSAALTAASASDSAEEAVIRIQFTSPTKPAVIIGTPRDRTDEAPDFRYLVVPLRALTAA